MNINSDAISVIIPCYGQAHFLSEAVASVLAQDPRPAEVIVVDDGSPDDVAGVLKSFPAVRLVRQPNGGLSAARNTGMRASTASNLVFLDADDRLLPGAIEAGLRCLAAHPQAAFIWGGYRNIDVDGRSFGRPFVPQAPVDPFAALLAGNVIGMHGAVVYRRSPLVATEGFDETLHACEDYDVYLRITRHHPVATHRALVTEYRRHRAGMSRDFTRLIAAGLEVLRRHTPDSQDPPSWRAAHRAGVRRLVRLNLLRSMSRGLHSLGKGDAMAMRVALRIALLYGLTLLSGRPPTLSRGQ